MTIGALSLAFLALAVTNSIAHEPPSACESSAEEQCSTAKRSPLDDQQSLFQVNLNVRNIEVPGDQSEEVEAESEEAQLKPGFWATVKGKFENETAEGEEEVAGLKNVTGKKGIGGAVFNLLNAAVGKMKSNAASESASESEAASSSSTPKFVKAAEHAVVSAEHTAGQAVTDAVKPKANPGLLGMLKSFLPGVVKQVASFVPALKAGMGTNGTKHVDFRKELGVNDNDWISAAVWCVLGGVLVFSLAGGLLDVLASCCGKCEGRPPLWSVFMTISSYGCLLPGWVSPLFSLAIGIHVSMFTIYIPSDGGQLEPMKESTLSFIGFLTDSDCWVGAIFITLYAIVVPIAKLLMLVVAEIIRYRHSNVARKLIRTVQIMSKWASPDMFAYVCLFWIFRKLDNQPTIMSAGVLEAGFTCYVVFCIFSTVAAVAIPMPPKEPETDTTPPMFVRMFGLNGTKMFALGALVAALILGSICLHEPLLKLFIQPDQIKMLKQYPAAKPLLTKLHIQDLLRKHVSLNELVSSLWEWFRDRHELNSLLAMFVWLFLVILFTAGSFVSLCFTSFRMSTSETKAAAAGRKKSFKIATVIGEFASLDVAIFGIFIITWAVKHYEKWGIHLKTGFGIKLALIIEVLHYLTWYVVSSTNSYLDALADQPEGLKEEAVKDAEQMLQATSTPRADSDAQSTSY
eukprot:gnl/TRDRNA2_/TRDRNA2_35346_c0_seq1.p1 gnl/TRDRNA2_/TRDRNA2_35346_c0~~gnl/TRDRNA2_/TRDRNA2_35346_c0_seq1.p1  ORF type:complete len:686 (-),score=138.15 gnl/TRDRNA2_/TRDRNA2_35346_c0_seq1:59-2116(-)